MDAPELILDALRVTGWSRAELARRAGIPQSVLSAYEHRSREPSVAALNRILAAAGRELRAGPGPLPPPSPSAGPLSPASSPAGPLSPAGSPAGAAAASLAGAPLAGAINEDTRQRARALRAEGIRPTLAVIVGTGDEASARYVRSLVRAAQRVEVDCEVVDCQLPRDGRAREGRPLEGRPTGGRAVDGGAVSGGAEGEAMVGRAMTEAVSQASDRADVHGVLIQTPLPAGLRPEEVASGLDPAKDVDGAGVTSAGRLALGLPAFAPATAAAVVELLAHYEVPLEGRRVALVGRSNVVGRPLAQLLTDRHATVTVCHSRTQDLPTVTAGADVVIAAAGRAGLIGPAHVGPGAVVIDVGTNVGSDGVLRGDVDPSVAAAGVAALTPVPGGIGPVTTAVLLRHTVDAASRALG